MLIFQQYLEKKNKNLLWKEIFFVISISVVYGNLIPRFSILLKRRS